MLAFYGVQIVLGKYYDWANHVCDCICPSVFKFDFKSARKSAQNHYSALNFQKFQLPIFIMILILIGNSEIDAHVRSDLCYFICLCHLIKMKVVRNRLFPLEKPIFTPNLSYHIIYLQWLLLYLEVVNSTVFLT